MGIRCESYGWQNTEPPDQQQFLQRNCHNQRSGQRPNNLYRASADKEIYGSWISRSRRLQNFVIRQNFLQNLSRNNTPWQFGLFTGYSCSIKCHTVSPRGRHVCCGLFPCSRKFECLLWKRWSVECQSVWREMRLQGRHGKYWWDMFRYADTVITPLKTIIYLPDDTKF